MTTVFISYNHSDKSKKDKIVSTLEAARHVVWFDEGLQTGDKLWEVIEKKITESDVFICLLSREWLESPSCKRELTLAYKLAKTIFPIRVRAIPDETFQKLAPDHLIQTLYDDWSGDPSPEQVAKILTAISKRVLPLPLSPAFIEGDPPIPPSPVTHQQFQFKSGAFTIGVTIAGGILLLIIAGICFSYVMGLGAFAPSNHVALKESPAPVPTVSIPTPISVVRTLPSASEMYFNIYTDANASDNHFFPTGYMGDLGDVSINETWANNPHSGNSAIKVVYTPKGKGDEKGQHTCALGIQTSNICKWAGTYWLNPHDNFGVFSNSGFNLSGFKKVTFWARTETPPTTIKFLVGGVGYGIATPVPFPSSLIPPRESGFQMLAETWKPYEISLEGGDLTYIIDGFGWTTNWANNEITPETPRTLIFYLDDIRFER